MFRRREIKLDIETDHTREGHHDDLRTHHPFEGKGSGEQRQVHYHHH